MLITAALVTCLNMNTGIRAPWAQCQYFPKRVKLKRHKSADGGYDSPPAVNIDLMLPYNTQTEPWPSIKTTRQIAPPSLHRAMWQLWQQLHLFQLTHCTSLTDLFIITISLFASCARLCCKWAGMTGGNWGQIIAHKLADTLSKWIHSQKQLAPDSFTPPGKLGRRILGINWFQCIEDNKAFSSKETRSERSFRSGVFHYYNNSRNN